MQNRLWKENEIVETVKTKEQSDYSCLFLRGFNFITSDNLTRAQRRKVTNTHKYILL